MLHEWGHSVLLKLSAFMALGKQLPVESIGLCFDGPPAREQQTGEIRQNMK